MQTETQTIIRKSNDLVSARFSPVLNIREARVLLLILTMIKPTDEDLQEYRFRIRDFMRAFDLKSRDVYHKIDEITDSLIKKVVKIPVRNDGKEAIFKTSLVNSFTYNKDGTGRIIMNFHAKLKPFLTQLQTRYLTYDIRQVMKLSSVNSLRIYEMLKQFQSTGIKIASLAEIKEILGLGEKYDRYYNLKIRVLEQAAKDLKAHTDIRFSYEELKIWRNVEKIKFYIHANEKPQMEAVPELGTTIMGRFNARGLQPDAVLKNLMKGQAESVVLAVFAEAEKLIKAKKAQGKAVLSENAYLLKVLQSPALWEKAKMQEEKRQGSGKPLDIKPEEDLKAQFQQELAAKTEALKQEYLTPELQKDILESLQGSILYDGALKDFQAGKINHMLKAKTDAYFREKYLSPSDYDYENRKAIKETSA